MSQQLIEVPAQGQEVRAKHEKVTDTQADLVDTLLQTGSTITKAAEDIGANRTWAVSTLKKQHVRAYARDMADVMLGGHALRALATMGDLLNAKSAYLRKEAATDLLDRYGLGREDGVISAPPVQVNIRID